MRRWILGWTFVVFVGWFIVGAVFSSGEADCTPSTSLICVSETWIFAIVAIYAAILWAVGLMVIALGWLLSHGWRNDDAGPHDRRD